MDQSTIGLIILLAAVVLYCTELIPLYITSILAALAMVFAGIIDFTTAFSSMGSSTIMLIIGMFIVGKAIAEVGIADIVGRFLIRILRGSERTAIVLICLVTALTSFFINPIIIVPIMMRIIDAVAQESNGKIRRKMIYLPVGVASLYGATLTSIGTTSMMNASAQLAATEYGRGLSLFAPAVITLSVVIVSLLYVSTVGHKLGERFFDFEELPPDEQHTPADKEIDKTKVAITLGVFVLAIVLFVTEYLPFGATALMCSCILILTGCVPVNVVNNIAWDQIFVIVGSIGLGAGVTASGAGTVLANLLIKLCGPMGNSPYFMVCFILLVATLLSNFMSNNAAVTIICPIAFAIGRRLGCDLLPFALAVGVGSNLSESTPISRANITLTTVAGYRFKDYVRYGGILNLINYIVCCVTLYIAFFA